MIYNNRTHVRLNYKKGDFMKTFARPIEVISYTDAKGDIRPIRFRLQTEDGLKVIKIDKVVFKHKEKLAGNEMILYRCQSVDGSQEKTFEIKYELCSCKWILFKM